MRSPRKAASLIAYEMNLVHLCNKTGAKCGMRQAQNHWTYQLLLGPVRGHSTVTCASAMRCPITQGSIRYMTWMCKARKACSTVHVSQPVRCEEALPAGTASVSSTSSVASSSWCQQLSAFQMQIRAESVFQPSAISCYDAVISEQAAPVR